MLQPLGLDETAQSVYRFVLARQGCSLADIVALLDIPETAARDSVDRLLDLCLLRRLSGSLLPGSPTVALRSLLQRQQADLLRREQEFAATRAAADQLIAEYDQVCGAGIRNEWERLDGIPTVHARTEVLTRQARIECLSLMPGDAQSADNLESRRPLDEKLLQNGVSVWTIYQNSIYNDRRAARYAEWLTTLGGEVRTSPTLPTWMLIFDRATALLPVDPETGHRSAFQVTGAGVITALVALFERVWTSATPLGTAACPIEDGPTNVERELLRLLSQGLTDEAVCKKLGIGLRTVRRMVADVMTKLDARSRFEAGANAVDRGWLRPCRCTSDRPPQPRRHSKCCDDELTTAASHETTDHVAHALGHELDDYANVP